MHRRLHGVCSYVTFEPTLTMRNKKVKQLRINFKVRQKEYCIIIFNLSKGEVYGMWNCIGCNLWHYKQTKQNTLYLDEKLGEYIDVLDNGGGDADKGGWKPKPSL